MSIAELSAQPLSLELATARGRSEADLWLPAAAAPHPLVLLGHGGGFPHQGRREPRLRRLARRLVDATGAAVLVIDGPAHGDRTPDLGSPQESARAARRALVEDGMPGWFVAEWRAAFDAAAARPDIDGGRAGYLGFSMGTLLGVPTVAAIPEIQAAVFGLGGVPKVGGVGELARKHGAPDAAVRVIDAEDDAPLRGRIVLEAAARIRDRQVLLLNMAADEVFPVEGAFELLNACASPARIAFFKGGHMELPAEALDLAAWFLGRCLAGDAPDGRPTGAW